MPDVIVGDPAINSPFDARHRFEFDEIGIAGGIDDKNLDQMRPLGNDGSGGSLGCEKRDGQSDSHRCHNWHQPNLVVK